MKRVIIAIFLVCLGLGCSQQPEKSSTSFDQAAAIAACEKVIADFQTALKQELIGAIADGGLENAIAVCNARAPMVADSFSRIPGIHIQRVSLRQRNPVIKPDSFETAILEKFAAEAGIEPQVYTELTFDSAETKYFRYMKEIKIGKLCLNCHGSLDTFSDGLKGVLETHYPDDPAVGYSAGESRGAFSVTITYPEAEATVVSLTGGQIN